MLPACPLTSAGAVSSSARAARPLMLEEYEHAVARGAKIYGEAVRLRRHLRRLPHHRAPAGRHLRRPGPSSWPWKRPAGSRRRPCTSTPTAPAPPMNDSLETQVVKLALGEEAARRAYISSTKSMTGHCLGAAGAIEAVACLKALEEGILPPTIHLEEPDPACDLNYVPNQALAVQADLVLSNSLGFGGHDACIAFRKVK